MNKSPLVIIDHTALIWAQDLIAKHGANAGAMASEHARTSRQRENLIHFCRWRLAGRIIATLDAQTSGKVLH
ncbi:MAG: hypothetical protein KGQ42_00440 [Alphaproteobacteria bacterium]|nr:hypothetical protein [Alphaproteobacteria bacterium]MDE2042624.1 hypothetical protein [Alphaproteobacteria bacterium]MDE2340658.1 hypothetical protein [Alphaproteobacteria bacterium]